MEASPLRRTRKLSLRRVVEAARDRQLADAYLWSIVFGIYGSDEHPKVDDLVRNLRSPPPVHGFAAIAFLDLANRLSLRGSRQEHSYAVADGVAFVEGLLRQSEHPSYARSATHVGLGMVGGSTFAQAASLAFEF